MEGDFESVDTTILVIQMSDALPMYLGSTVEDGRRPEARYLGRFLGVCYVCWLANSR